MTDQRGRSPGAEPDERSVVRSWLGEDRHEDATRVLGVVLNGLDTAPQRRSPGSAWRTLAMNKYLPIGLGVAAVVVVALIGYQWLGGSNQGGPAPSESPQPTATPAASAPADGSLAVGSSHVLWDASDSLGMKITVTIPAAAWFGAPGEGVLKKNDNAGAPEGAGVTVFARTNDLLEGLGDLYVYGDPCHWDGTKPFLPVTTVREAINALSAQTSRGATAVIGVTYDGYSGQYLTLHVPDDAVFSGCDQGEFRTLVEGRQGGVARSHEDPGQYDLITVLDVKGELVVFDVAYYDGTPSTVIDEMGAIVESATIEYQP